MKVESGTKKMFRRELVRFKKKGVKDFKKAAKEERQMKQMEEAALEAYKRDLEANPDFSGKLLASSTSNNALPLPEDEIPASSIYKLDKVWYEALSEAGYRYFWNINSGESIWEPPPSFVSISEQERMHRGDTKPIPKPAAPVKKSKGNKFKAKKEIVDRSVPSSSNQREVSMGTFGPIAKSEPLGSWQTVEVKKEENVDLQTPVVPSSNDFKLPDIKEEKKPKFQEKIIKEEQCTYGEVNVSFKKRRLDNGAKRNARQRSDDY